MMRFGHHVRLCEQGIYQVDVDIDENYMLVEDFRFVYVGYKDHEYTTAHFHKECQIIHHWCSVCSLAKTDYTIDRPRRQRHDNVTGRDGAIRVKVPVH